MLRHRLTGCAASGTSTWIHPPVREHTDHPNTAKIEKENRTARTSLTTEMLVLTPLTLHCPSITTRTAVIEGCTSRSSVLYCHVSFASFGPHKRKLNEAARPNHEKAAATDLWHKGSKRTRKSHDEMPMFCICMDEITSMPQRDQAAYCAGLPAQTPFDSHSTSTP